jgi:hypothetical protein
MPGGNNPYTRPANKPERAALKRQSARNAAMKNLEKRREENIKADKSIYGSGSEDRQILENMKRKSSDRKADMFKMEKGGAVKGYMGGGKVRGYKDGGGVCRGGGAAVGGTKFRGVK